MPVYRQSNGAIVRNSDGSVMSGEDCTCCDETPDCTNPIPCVGSAVAKTMCTGKRYVRGRHTASYSGSGWATADEYVVIDDGGDILHMTSSCTWAFTLDLEGTHLVREYFSAPDFYFWSPIQDGSTTTTVYTPFGTITAEASGSVEMPGPDGPATVELEVVSVTATGALQTNTSGTSATVNLNVTIGVELRGDNPNWTGPDDGFHPQYIYRDLRIVVSQGDSGTALCDGTAFSLVPAAGTLEVGFASVPDSTGDPEYDYDGDVTGAMTSTYLSADIDDADNPLLAMGCPRYLTLEGMFSHLGASSLTSFEPYEFPISGRLALYGVGPCEEFAHLWQGMAATQATVFNGYDSELNLLTVTGDLALSVALSTQRIGPEFSDGTLNFSLSYQTLAIVHATGGTFTLTTRLPGDPITSGNTSSPIPHNASAAAVQAALEALDLYAGRMVRVLKANFYSTTYSEYVPTYLISVAGTGGWPGFNIINDMTPTGTATYLPGTQTDVGYRSVRFRVPTGHCPTGTLTLTNGIGGEEYTFDATERIDSDPSYFCPESLPCARAHHATITMTWSGRPAVPWTVSRIQPVPGIYANSLGGYEFDNFLSYDEGSNSWGGQYFDEEYTGDLIPFSLTCDELGNVETGTYPVTSGPYAGTTVTVSA